MGWADPATERASASIQTHSGATSILLSERGNFCGERDRLEEREARIEGWKARAKWQRTNERVDQHTESGSGGTNRACMRSDERKGGREACFGFARRAPHSVGFMRDARCGPSINKVCKYYWVLDPLCPHLVLVNATSLTTSPFPPPPHRKHLL